ncbi:hypothetical protein E4U50_005458 [Claviceps purpurea]|nr:hypothetical protein E4U50_005458 [Claviceps purpurea]
MRTRRHRGSHGALFRQRLPVTPRTTAPQTFRKSQDRSGDSSAARGKLEDETNISFHRLESKPTTLRTVLIENLEKTNVLIYSLKKLHRRLFPKIDSPHRTPRPTSERYYDRS